MQVYILSKLPKKQIMFSQSPMSLFQKGLTEWMTDPLFFPCPYQFIHQYFNKFQLAVTNTDDKPFNVIA